MKKFIATLLLGFTLLNIVPQNASAKETPPTVSADSAVLMDASTGEILYTKNPDSAYPPASTTKTMTALLTLEKCKLDDVVTVGKNPPLADGSKIYIFQDEQIKVKDLLYALFLVSANDCAEALAEHIGGSMDNFTKLMNDRAKELGCTNTNFVNPSGLYDEKHKTSAKDLALIMRELAKHPEFKEIATTLSYKIAPTNKSAKERPLFNENKLIQKFSKSYYEGIEGGKTGYTIQSDHSYVASATRNGQRLIVALVHDKNKTFFSDATNLFNYGFNNFQLIKMYSKGDKVTTYTEHNLNIPLFAADDFYYVKDKTDTSIPSYNISPQDLSCISFNSGDKVLEAKVTFNNKEIGSISLLSGSDHKLLASPDSYKAQVSHMSKNVVITIVLLSVISVISAALTFRRIKTIRNRKG